jgi:hypothetical protein
MAMGTQRILWIALAVLCVSFGRPAAGKAISFGNPEDRPDRLVTITGPCQNDLLAKYSTDGGASWQPATIYLGTTIDQWRTTSDSTWNNSTINGRIPAGQQASVWNYFFDVPMPASQALLRLDNAATGQLVSQQAVSFGNVGNVVVDDYRNFAQLAGGSLPSPWTMVAGTKKTPSANSVFCSVQNPSAAPLVFNPNLSGYYRVYVGMETNPTLQLSLSKENVKYPVPEYFPTPANRPMQEVCVESANMTGQSVSLALGGARTWRDASVRYVRFVPMSQQEVNHFHEVRQLANTQGRPFAGYMEQCTAAYYEPAALTLQDHTRNEMRLNKERGSTDVYVHVVRVGSKAWYHSDVVDRFYGWGNWGNWMAQGDPLAVAVAEGHAAGLKVFADMGMDVSYKIDGLQDSMIVNHPEYVYQSWSDRALLDYRVQGVREYAASIANELMTKYNVDGVNLDFARFAISGAFPQSALVDVMQRINMARHAAEAKWGHQIKIACRIPSYLYRDTEGGNPDYAAYVAALQTWARNGWIDRVMACGPGTPAADMQLSVARYAAAIAGTNVQLWGDLYEGGTFPGTGASDWMNVARKWVGEGLNGGFFLYDTSRPTELDNINWQLRLIDFPNAVVEPGGGTLPECSTGVLTFEGLFCLFSLAVVTRWRCMRMPSRKGTTGPRSSTKKP